MVFFISLLLVFAVITFLASYVLPPFKNILRIASATLAGLGVIGFLLTCFTIVPASNVGVQRFFGKVQDHTLSEGLNWVKPGTSVQNVYIGQHAINTTGSEAASKDLQVVHADLVVNVTVADPLALYRVNTTLTWPTLIVQPAVQEVFKSVVAHYTAEELITKRAEVSTGITTALRAKLQQYHLNVQLVNLTNFGFSKSFNASIEEKVTANQKAATAENNLKRIEFEAKSRITQAEGEAKAIAIQSAAIEKSGGQGYVQLQAIEKWDGKLPGVMGAGPTPFINVK